MTTTGEQTSLDESNRIPKVVFGNPETQDLAYDLIPDWVPHLSEHLRLFDGEWMFDRRKLNVSLVDSEFLSLCTDHLSAFQICMKWSHLRGVTPHSALEDGFKRLKWARTLGLVLRDNKPNTPATFMRIRTLHPAGPGPPPTQWFYFPAKAHRVLTLCSGSFTCRTIARTLLMESECIPSEGALLVETAAVVSFVKWLVSSRIASWIDDSLSRRGRLGALLS